MHMLILLNSATSQLNISTKTRNNYFKFECAMVNTTQEYTMNGGIGVIYTTPWIFYMYINRGPLTYLHSLISLLDLS
jgi:hypothetical protein